MTNVYTGGYTLFPNRLSLREVTWACVLGADADTSKGLEEVPDHNFTGLEDARQDAAVTPNRVVTPRPERLFHPRTWMAEPRALEKGAAEAKTPLSKREQVDTRHHQVAPEPFGGRGGAAERGDDRQVFGLDQCDLPRRARGAFCTVVALQTAPRQRVSVVDAYRLHAPRRTQQDQLEPPPLRQRV